jgi:hypothetical protein
VHFERLAIEASDTTFTLEFHERLTVIAGVGRLERDGLVSELIGALSSGRSGVHLEVVSDAGARYAIFRPVGAPHRVVDIDKARDVSTSFTDREGRVNLLQRAGLSEAEARRAMRVSESDLASESKQEHYLLSLARVESGRLWDVAAKVKDRESVLNKAAEELGSTPEDAELFQEIEKRHHEFELAQAEVERVRRYSFFVAMTAAIVAIPGALFLGPLVTVPLLIAAIATAGYSATYWRKLAAARKREQAALAEAGANSYLNFQINRVNGLLSNDHRRRQLMHAAEDHRAALAEWQLLVGDIPVEWALEHRRDVNDAHRRLVETTGIAPSIGTSLTPIDETTADIADALRARLDATRTLGAGGESFPTFLDDPFINATDKTKAELLELLVNASANQQIIYLTNDEDVASWARLEAMTTQVSIIEPGVSQDGGRTGDDDDIPRRSRHVAA